jgi:hypothetical protein
MKISPSIAALLLAASAVVIPAAFAAEHMSEAESEVWAVIEASWVDETEETGAWPSEYLHEDAHSWGADWPMPRNAESIVNWARAGASANETLVYELFPMGVTVTGDTAMAYYSAVQITENHEGKRERESTGLVETLVRTDAGWKFVGLTSFEIGSGD